MKRKILTTVIVLLLLGSPLACITTTCLESARKTAMSHKKDWTSASWMIGQIAWIYRYTGRYEQAVRAYDDYLDAWDNEAEGYPENMFLEARTLEDWWNSLDYNASPEQGARRKEIKERTLKAYDNFVAWFPDHPKRAEAEGAARRLRQGY